MRHKISCVILAAAMLAALAGCGGQTAQPEQPEQMARPAQTVQAAQPTQSPQPAQHYTLIEDYAGQAYAQADSSLKGKLTIREIDVYSQTAEEGLIVGQYPYAGKEVIDGGEITLFVSAGPNPLGWSVDGLPAADAQGVLAENEIAFREEDEYTASVQEGQVIGLAEQNGEYVLYVSKGVPELQVSGRPGYAVKSNGLIYYTDNQYIYSMNPDGTDKQEVVKINEIEEIVPYGEWLIYLDVENGVLSAYNCESGVEKVLAKNSGQVHVVVDGWLYWSNGGNLHRISLVSGRDEVVANGYISGMDFYANQLVYTKYNETGEDGGRSGIISYDLTNGEQREIMRGEFIWSVGVDFGRIYFTKGSDGGSSEGMALCSVNMDGGDLETLLSESVVTVYRVYNQLVLFDTYSDGEYNFHIYNTETHEETVLCSGDELLGLDEQNGWYYCVGDDDKTYRIRSDGQDRQLFAEKAFYTGYYYGSWTIYSHLFGLVFIDDWIYYFDHDYGSGNNPDGILSRYNTETGEYQQLADGPTRMPWWAAT